MRVCELLRERGLDIFYKLRIFLNFFYGMKGFCSGFSALLALGNYNFKSNKLFGAFLVKVKQLLEMAKSCSLNLIGPFFAN